MDQQPTGQTGQILAKGERTHLVDKDGGALTRIHFGAGWDVNRGSGGSYDLDIFAICMTAEKKMLPGDLHKSVLYYANKTLPGLTHGGDNLTGQGEGDDEAITIDVSQLPAEVAEILIGMNIYNAASKGNQNFGQVDNAFIRFADGAAPATTVKKFNLTEDYSAFNAVMMGRLYKAEDGAGWKFQAVGTGANGAIEALAAPYRS